MAGNQLVATLTIPSGSAESPALSRIAFQSSRSLTIIAPATMTGTSTTLKCARDESASTTWVPVQSPPGTDIVIAPDTAIPLVKLPFPQLKLVSNATELADRVFYIWGDVGQ